MTFVGVGGRTAPASGKVLPVVVLVVSAGLELVPAPTTTLAMTSAAIVEEIRGKVNTKVAPENFAKNVSVTLCHLQHKKLVQKAGNEYSLTE